MPQQWNPRIRTLFKQEELPLLYEIEKECFSSSFRWNKTEFAAQLSKHNVWIIEDEFPDETFIDVHGVSRGGKTNIVGFLVAKIFRGVAYILTVEVPEKYRGRGYGAALVAACEKDYKRRGFKFIRLEVFTDNPAQVMYFKLGYRVNGFKQDFYEKGKSAIAMAKTL